MKVRRQRQREAEAVPMESKAINAARAAPPINRAGLEASRPRSPREPPAAADDEAEDEVGGQDGGGCGSGRGGDELPMVAPEAAEGPNEPNAGEASREPDAGQGSREPDVAGGSGEPDAAEGPREPVPHAAQLAIVPYVQDIDVVLRSLEAEESRRPILNYDQEIQGGNINMRMRGKLVDWMAELVHASNIRDNILYLAVSFVDRFLSRNVISKDRLQLLGASALFVSSKYEDIRHPSAGYFSVSTAYTYTAQQVVDMEADILRFLNYKMGSPTVITFLRRFLFSCRGDNRSRNIKLELMCNYFAELSLLDDYNIRFLPSIVAAACLFVAKFTLNPNTRPWNLSVQRNTGYKVSDIEDCIHAIHDLQAGRIKYEDDEFECVSKITSPKRIKPSFLRDLMYANG